METVSYGYSDIGKHERAKLGLLRLSLTPTEGNKRGQTGTRNQLSYRCRTPFGGSLGSHRGSFRLASRRKTKGKGDSFPARPKSSPSRLDSRKATNEARMTFPPKNCRGTVFLKREDAMETKTLPRYADNQIHIERRCFRGTRRNRNAIRTW